MSELEYCITSKDDGIYVEYQGDMYRRIMFIELIHREDFLANQSREMIHSVAFRTIDGKYSRNWSSPIKIMSEREFISDSGLFEYMTILGEYGGTLDDMFQLLESIRDNRNAALMNCKHKCDFVSQLALEVLHEKVFS